MTDQQINQAIAKACGIVGKDEYGPLYQTPEGWVVDCPKFATDLNSIHEALKTLPPDQLWDVAYSLPMETMLGFMATARELAETFLLVIGKWEATTEESSAVQKKVQL